MDYPTPSGWNRTLLIKYMFLLLILCIVAYWPLTFGLYSLKNDAIIYFLPVRYTISECISNGYWPFWSPYLNLGYPIHTDMQSGAWNPIVQLISLAGPYTLQTLSYETMLYVYLSGLGMLLLLKHFRLAPGICLLFSCAYMLSGFNTDSSQFLYWISGAAFLPFTFLFYYRMLTKGHWNNSILFGFFLYLFFTTAYPAQFILLSYFLLAFTIWHFYNAKKTLTWKVGLQYLRNISVACILFFLFALPAILSYSSFIAIMNRGAGVSFELAMSNPLHPVYLFSYILPLPVWRVPSFSVTDPLTRNCFIGLIPFALLTYFLFTKVNNRLYSFLKISFFVFLLFSFGEMGLIRSIAYYLLPLMNTFRHPSIAKLFFNFSAILLAALCLQNVGLENIKTRKRVFVFIVGIAFLVLGWSFFESHFIWTSTFSSSASFLSQLKNSFEKLTFTDLTILNFVIQVPFFILLYFAFVKKVRLPWLVWGSVLNCLLFAALFQPFTVVRAQTMAKTEHIIKSIERKGFPKPDLNTSITANSASQISAVLKDGPLTVYSKTIAHTFNFTAPATLNTHNTFWAHGKLRKLIFSYPLLYRADTVIQFFDTSYTYKNKIALLDTQPTIPIESKVPYTASIKDFTPNSWSLTITSNKPGFYCLQQNNLDNWKLYVDGKKQDIIQANYTYIGFSLQPGTHNIDLKYEAPAVKVAFWISFITILTALFLMIAHYVKTAFKVKSV